MRYDFHKLKTIHCLDAVTIRVPERWTKSVPWQNNAWNCYEDDEETGCLWIRHDRFKMPTTADDSRFPKLLRIFKSGWTDPPDANYYVDTMTKTADGYVWSRVYDSTDAKDGTPIRDFGCMFFQVRGPVYFATDIKLVLPCFVLDDPEIQDLIDIMGREILAAKIEPVVGDDAG